MWRFFSPGKNNNNMEKPQQDNDRKPAAAKADPQPAVAQAITMESEAAVDNVGTTGTWTVVAAESEAIAVAESETSTAAEASDTAAVTAAKFLPPESEVAATVTATDALLPARSNVAPLATAATTTDPSNLDHPSGVVKNRTIGVGGGKASVVPKKRAPRKKAPTKKGTKQSKHTVTTTSAEATSYKGKRRSSKRRSSKSSASGNLNTSTSTVPLKRTGSAQRRRVQPVRDALPHRLVNPLLELPHGSSLLRPTATDLYSLVDLGTTMATNDTFPIAYIARVLGFDVPLADPVATTPHTLDVSRAPLVNDAANYRHVPARGTFFETVWRPADATVTTAVDKDTGASAASTWTPPILSSQQWSGSTLTAITSAQHAKLSLGVVDRQHMLHVVVAAHTQLGKADDNVTSSWSFQTVADFQHDHPTLQAEPNEQGLFCLQELVPIGLVVYRFAWWQPANDSSPNAAELVLEIEDVRQTAGSLWNLQNDDANQDKAIAISEQRLVLFLLALALEHARERHVWYAVLQVPKGKWEGFLERYFLCTAMGETANGLVQLRCEIYQCSARYAFLMFAEDLQKKDTNREGEQPTVATTATTLRQRVLVRLPNVDDATTALQAPPDQVDGNASMASTLALGRSSKRSSGGSRKPSCYLTGASPATRPVTVRVRAQVSANDVTLLRLDADQNPLGPLTVPTFYAEPSLDIMRSFARPAPAACVPEEEKEDDPLVRELKTKQQELETLEKGFEPKLRTLMQTVVDERIEYEKSDAAQQRAEQERVLLENQKVLERRKEMDMAWQKQLEQDMNAVCDICDDGEVSPDNQILFCEACNVAVHQRCYGIERVPEGDYYCIACVYLGRERTALARDVDAPKMAATALPLCCELCPRKQGAFIRTDMPLKEDEASVGKWVHSVCAKWQGLNFVDNQRTDLVEDVSELKVTFRLSNIVCDLCQGERGAMNRCRFPDCNKWIHVTCARSARNCDVVHGENNNGPVEKNPWTLMCPDHSNIKEADIPADAVPVEKLVALAKEFPPEPKPDPLPLAPKPFNSATGPERKRLLANDEYEQELLSELMFKKMYGVRCEVCDHVEDFTKNINRCVLCNVVFCQECRLSSDNVEGNYKCPGCSFVETKKKQGEEVEEPPQCVACYQKGGLLRPGSATPINKRQWRDNNSDAFQRSMFGRQLWVHSLCTFWNYSLSLSDETGEVNLSNVVLSNGKGFILSSTKCLLCGNDGGLKVKCDHEGCRRDKDVCFHVSCARQAGLEVRTSEVGRRTNFYVRCYRHGGNEFNLRARLEDLIEIEKRRSGKKLARADAPMKFADASRLLNSSILVMRILGWAWRWGEWWVDYSSSWEPLLEPDQSEKDMTKEQLGIVDSTRESRCEDARKCRLTALAAALRNRCYDTEETFDRASLDRALRALLHTKSLVGPLTENEIEFYIDWLGRAYRSKSRLLGFGDDRIPVCNGGFCVHIKDQSPKFELGIRPVPGKLEVGADVVFETGIEEVDDFLLTEVIDDKLRMSPRLKVAPKPKVEVEVQPSSVPRKPTSRKDNRKRKRDGGSSDFASHRSKAVAAVAPSAVKKRRGRPPKNRHESPQGTKRRGRPPKKHPEDTVYLDQASEPAASDSPTKGSTDPGTAKASEYSPSRTSRGRTSKRVERLGFGIADVASEDDGDIEDRSPPPKRRRPAEATEFRSTDPMNALSDLGRRFLSSIGIKTADQLLSAVTLDVARKYVSWRRQEGMIDLKGSGAASVVCQWKSFVRKRAEETNDEVGSIASNVSTPSGKRRGRPPKIRKDETEALESTEPPESGEEKVAAKIPRRKPRPGHQRKPKVSDSPTEQGKLPSKAPENLISMRDTCNCHQARCRGCWKCIQCSCSCETPIAPSERARIKSRRPDAAIVREDKK